MPSFTQGLNDRVGALSVPHPRARALLPGLLFLGLPKQARPLGDMVMKYPKFEDSSFRLGPPVVEDVLGAGEVLGGAGGLGGEAATLEPQAPVPPAGTDVVAKDAG